MTVFYHHLVQADQKLKSKEVTNMKLQRRNSLKAQEDQRKVSLNN